MKEICKKSFISSLGTAVYIVLVATFMTNASRFFGNVDTVVSGTAMLLLFSLSALVVGGLTAGGPILMYIDGKKKEAVLMLYHSPKRLEEGKKSLSNARLALTWENEEHILYDIIKQIH